VLDKFLSEITYRDAQPKTRRIQWDRKKGYISLVLMSTAGTK